jgi:hypothetical protein
MSLKTFHAIFISISVLLCLGFGAWCAGSDQAHGHTAYMVAEYVSFGLSIVLVMYEIWFLRKFKDLDAE